MLQEDTLTLSYYVGTSFAFILIAFILIYIQLHQRKMSKYKLALKENELRAQQQIFMSLAEGEEKERARLAEELHDGIGTKLVGIRMNVNYLKDSLRKATTETDHSSKSLITLVNKIDEHLEESIQEVREISQNLLPSFLLTKGLGSALKEFTQQLEKKGTCKYKLVIQLEPNHINERLQIIIFRIVSELLNNVQRHASATYAFSQVIQYDDSIQIVIEDNGVGFDPKNAVNGIGLMNIKNRLHAIQGTVEIDSSSKGTTIIVDIPIHKALNQ